MPRTHGIQIGDKFGEWTVVGLQKGQQNIIVRCSCANTEKAIDSHSLRAGKSTRCRSCGTRYGMGNKNRRITGDALPFNDKYLEYRRRGEKTKGFSLTREEFRTLIGQDCYYCGARPAQVHRAPLDKPWADPLVYNGLDRYDTSRGYSADNVVACCGRCNRMKNNMSYDEFIEHMQKILKNRTRR